MKKWNSSQVRDILNTTYVNGIKENTTGFEIDQENVVAYDIDRGARVDHGGGESGDDWMDSEQINALIDIMVRRHLGKLTNMIKILKTQGFKAQWSLDYGEKGHVSIFISEVKKATPTVKKTVKKGTKGLNQTDFIRMKINGLANREMIIQGLAKNFKKTEAWAKSRFATYEKAYGSFGKNDPKKDI